ncbi:hypothetical protein NP0155_00140 [Helicobacter pylori]
MEALTKEQQQVLKVFKGELNETEIKGIDLNDLYTLEQGSKKGGAKKDFNQALRRAKQTLKQHRDQPFSGF